MAQNDSIRQLIQDYKDKTRAEIEFEVWRAITPEARERLGHAQLRRLIAAELNDPNQLEFLIEDEPYPLEEVPIDLLQRRANRLKAMIKTLQTRLEACLAEIKARQNAKGAK